MAMKYHQTIQIRLNDEDIKLLEKISQDFDIPRAALMRRAWREWAKRLETQQLLFGREIPENSVTAV